MWCCGNHYEYLATFVDYLKIASKDPDSIINILINDYKFKLKGTGPLHCHIGCDLYRDVDDNLCISPNKYIERLLNNFESICGENPSRHLKRAFQEPSRHLKRALGPLWYLAIFTSITKTRPQPVIAEINVCSYWGGQWVHGMTTMSLFGRYLMIRKRTHMRVTYG